MHCCHGSTRTKEPTSPMFPLALAAEGERVRIVRLGGCCLQERLLSMGIALDDVITVIRRQDGGAMLIEKDGSRYALGGGMALKINVSRW